MDRRVRSRSTNRAGSCQGGESRGVCQGPVRVCAAGKRSSPRFVTSCEVWMPESPPWHPRLLHRPPGDVVELRVHGVSGGDADDILDRPHVQRVAGDHKGGFYRPREGYGDSRGACGVVLETYRWSELPSGAAARTLSLVFLLPFMACNAAAWMRPRAKISGGVVWVGCRLVGLSLTVLYVLSFVGVALDLLACKCMSRGDCLAGRTWLSWLGGQPVGLRMALLALVPVAAIWVLWLAGSRCGHWYHNFIPPSGTTADTALGAIGTQNAMPGVGRLHAIHVATGLVVLDLSLITALWSARGPRLLDVVLTACAVAVFCVSVVLLCLPSVIDAAAGTPVINGVLRALRSAAVAVTIVVIGRVAFDRTEWPAGDGLPGHDVAVVLLFGAQGTLLALLGIAALAGRDRRQGSRPRLRGLGAPLFACLAVGLAVSFATEFNYRVSDYLDRDQPTPDVLPTSPVLPYKWTMFGFFLSVIGAAVAGAVMVVLSWRHRRRTADGIVARDFPEVDGGTARRRAQVRDAIARAHFTERLGPLAVTYCCVVALSLGFTAAALAELQPSVAAEGLVSLPSDFVSAGTQFGSYLMALLFVGLLFGGLFAYRTLAFRRYIGMLWDLGMFWPRAAHPFAPPCYAERAVPELACRISMLARQGRYVLVAAHSHGSVLALASILQLEPYVLSRVALLTHGCPLRRFYSTMFPAYVGTDVLSEAGRRLGWRWVNLWRDTDPIGGWIFTPSGTGDDASRRPPEVDRRLRDPQQLDARGNDTVWPPMHGHRPCVTDDRYEAAVCELSERLRTG
ncbi:hypothetical protein ACSNN7_01130 [Micromonospora sp. URMC 105]|uniref:hypothetical protein n=1 Tax=Micromonospora sp. URMC 105 TaxID=3423413 RepID=UPI003F1BF3E8